MFPIVPDVIASLRAGQVRALTLAANSVSEILSGVPPMPQLGYPDLAASAWVALYAPTKSPAAVIERLRIELDALLASSAFVERMKQVGIEVNRMRPDEFAAFARQERSRWDKLIGSLDLKIE
jgi:tripartite-type tricarboxylate transporter receptor subunit TctC